VLPAGESLNRPLMVASDAALQRLRTVLKAALYSASRLSVSLSGVLLSIIALRLLPTADAHGIVVSLTLAAFLANIFVAWKEQIIHRFAGGRLLQWLPVEAVLLVAGLWFFHEQPWLMAALVMGDVAYRAVVANLQMQQQDAAYTTLNLARAAAEVGLGVWMLPNPLPVLALMRALFFGVAWWRQRAAPALPEKAWPYARTIFGWLLLIQFMQYLPQIFASFRLFSQASTMGASIAIIYLQPRLFLALRDAGEAGFAAAWRRWLPGYVLFSVGIMLLVLAGFPLLLRFGVKASLQWSLPALLLSGPAMLSMAMANYVQKPLEAGERILPMLWRLGAATALLGGLLLLANSAAAIAAAAALANVFYLFLVCEAARCDKSVDEHLYTPLRVIRNVAGVVAVLLAGIFVTWSVM
jgi:hypothetical protein